MKNFKGFLREKQLHIHIHPEGGDWKADVRDRLQQGLQGGTPDHPSFMPGGMTAGAGRLTAALRFGKDIIAGKPGEPHSELASFAKDKPPDEMGFVNKPTGDTNVGPHKGFWYSRQDATRIGNKFPKLKHDPTPEDPKYPSQSFDFKPESGKVQWNPTSANPNLIQSPDASTYAQRGKDAEQSSKELKKNPQDWLQKRGVPDGKSLSGKPPSVGPDSEGGKKRSESGGEEVPQSRAQVFKSLIKQHPEILGKLFAEGGKKTPIKAAYPPPTGGAGYSSPPAESGKKRAEGSQLYDPKKQPSHEHGGLLFYGPHEK